MRFLPCEWREDGREIGCVRVATPTVATLGPNRLYPAIADAAEHTG